MKSELMKTDNELIAEFMGLDVYKNYDEMKLVPLEQLKKYAYINELEYDTSWDRLMPVVDKIEQLGFNSDLKYTDWRPAHKQEWCLKFYGARDRYSNPFNFSTESKIDAVFKAVVDFIKWHNVNTRIATGAGAF